MTFINVPAPTFLLPLVSAAIRALAVAGVAGLAVTAFRVKTTSVRLFTWTAVLYVALAMPLLERILPALAVPAPAFLQPAIEQPAARTSPPVALAPIDLTAPHRHATPATMRLTPHQGFDWSTIRGSWAAAGIYLATVFLLLTRLLVGLAFGRRLRLASQPIRESSATARLVAHARADGLSFVPQAAESTVISVPVTMGILRAIVFLPATWRTWDEAKLDAVVAHEVSHVARRAPLTQRLSFLHCAIFWFSPLAWWLNRHLADLMEQASDEAALAGGADRRVYARTLLGFFEALQGAPGRVWWQGVAMATAGRAERRAEERVENILVWKGAVAMRFKKSMVVLVIALVVPVVYLTASAHPTGISADSPVSPRLEIAQNEAPPPPASGSKTARPARRSS